MRLSSVFGWLLALAMVCGSAEAQVVIEDYQAFNVLGFNTTGIYDFEDPYTVAGQPWKAWLAPGRPIQIARGGTANFLAVLTAAFPTWTFNTAAASLSAAALRVHSYSVDGSPGYVGIDQVPNIGFHVQYVPSGTDPLNNIHWIQVVTNNHAIGTGGGHGVNENIVDNSGAADPFYDTLGAANGRHFLDAPGRLDGNQSHFWVADLYLVELTAAQTVTIYDGIRWGWVNAPVPEPTMALAFSVGSVLILAIIRKGAGKKGGAIPLVT